MNEATPEVRTLAEERAAARADGDFARADVLRERISNAGWAVVDEPAGWRLEPIAEAITEPLRPADVPSLLGEPATADVSMHWVCEGWPEDIRRAITAFRANEGGRDVRYVVADTKGADPDAFGEGIDVLTLEPGTGWAAARNVGLIRSTGRVVIAMDGSIEVTGDAFSPLVEALADPRVGIAGPFGIVTHDLREFEQASGPGDCDAIEGYCMAMRRETLTDVGMFDERFRWYRTADIEYSFRVKDAGLRTVVVPLPVTKHNHRMWFETEPAERAKLSKRNYYRFLDRWRDRWDLVLDPRPPAD